MKSKLMTIFTRTPLHVGAGNSVGAIDSPVVRERHTRFPYIPGSSIKGVLSDLWVDANFKRTEDGAKLFGAEDSNAASAGSIYIGEAKLLAFPVRSAKGCFAWVTCPLVLTRFVRDNQMEISIPNVHADGVIVTEETILKIDNQTIFEEYPFVLENKRLDMSIVQAFAVLSTDSVWGEISKRLAIVSDEMFAYFVENACEVAQHIRIDDETGVVAKGALFNQENVPSETLFYSVLGFKNETDIPLFEEKVTAQNNVLQFGGDITTGLGWSSIEFVEVRA